MFSEGLILFLVVVTLILGLGFLVFSQNNKNSVNRSFLLFAIFIAVWVAANYLQDEAASRGFKISLLKLDFASGVLASYFFFEFCIHFSQKYLGTRSRRWLIYRLGFFMLSLFIAMQALFTNNVVWKAEFLPDVVNPIYGPFYLPYLLLLLSQVLAGLVCLLIKHKREPETTKKRTRLIFAGFGVMIVSVLLTNVVLPIFLSEQADFIFYSRLGAYSILFLVVLISYSIARYDAFRVKIFSAELFSGSLVLVFFLEILSSADKQAIFLRSVMFLLVLYFAWMFTQSLRRELEGKKKLQQMTTELASANKKLVEIDKTKSEFISIASHQLRTPLTSIKGFSSLLMEGSYGRLGKEQRETIEKIYVSNERLIMLVEDLLNISRIERGKIQYEYEDVNLEELAKNVLSIMRIQAKNKHLYIKFKNDAKDLPSIKADLKKLAEVIGNLVDNAIKYTPKGGVTVALSRKGELARISISDTGIGISREEIPTLFEKFVRGKDVNKLHTGGTGLGLYVVKKIVEAHEGKVWVESPGLEKGTTFVVELPIKPA